MSTMTLTEIRDLFIGAQQSANLSRVTLHVTRVHQAIASLNTIIASQPAEQPRGENLVGELVSGICELTRADPDDPNTVCVNVDSLVTEIERTLLAATPEERQPKPEQAVGDGVKNLVASLQSLRDRWMAETKHDGHDGDFDVLLEAINTLKRPARPAVATPAEVTDEMVLAAARAMQAQCDGGDRWQRLSDTVRAQWIESVRPIVAALTAQCQVRKDGQGVASCDWPAGNSFTVLDDPDEHKPCYLVMPDGAALPLCHHATNGVDQARAKFIADACNAALASPSAGAVVPEVDFTVEEVESAIENVREYNRLMPSECIDQMRDVLLLAAAPEVDRHG